MTKQKEKIQIDQIIMERTNIKTLSRYVADTEKGSLELCLDRGDSSYYLRMNGEKLSGLESVIENLVEQI